MSTENTAGVPEGNPKVKLTISQIKKDLHDGFDRKAIAKKYGLNQAAVQTLFQHDKLKGLKVRRAANVELEDDVPDEPVTAKAVPKAATAKATTAKATKVEAVAEPVGAGESKVEEGGW